MGLFSWASGQPPNGSLPRNANSADEERDELSVGHNQRSRRRISYLPQASYFSPSQNNAKQQQEERERERVLAEHERQKKDLDIKLDASEVENERLKARLDERRDQIKELEQSLDKGKQSLGECKKKLDEYEKKCETLGVDYNKLAREYNVRIGQLNESNGKIKLQNSEIVTLKQATVNSNFHLKASEKLATEQALEITNLQKEAEKHRFHITELTGAILDSSQPAAAGRDDDYFSGEFARLAGGIRQFVLRHFDVRDAPEFRHRDLPEAIAGSLQKTILGCTTAPDSMVKIGRKEIEAVISQRLTERVFNSSFVFRMYRWPPIPNTGFIGVTARETHKFRAQVADMLTKHEDFESRFSDAVRKITEDLQRYFSSLVKVGMEGAHCKVLHTIVEQAARLEVEVARELSRFLVPQLKPGMEYLPACLDDISGTVDNDDDTSDDDGDDDTSDDDTSDDEEGQKVKGGKERKDKQGNEVDQKKEQREFIVDAVLFPPVFRWEFDDAGNILEQEIIVRKGVVTATRSQPNDGDMVMETEPIES